MNRASAQDRKSRYRLSRPSAASRAGVSRLRALRSTGGSAQSSRTAVVTGPAKPNFQPISASGAWITSARL